MTLYLFERDFYGNIHQWLLFSAQSGIRTNCAGLQYSVDLDWSIDLVVEEQPQMVTHVHIWIGDSKLYGEGCIN